MGMIVADAIGIGAGVMLYKHVPEKKVKLVSAGIFILFGLFGVYSIIYARLYVANKIMKPERNFLEKLLTKIK